MPKELPEASLIRRTFIVREMDFPPNVSLTKRSLLRWTALSLGLISGKESRGTVLDVLDSFLHFQLSQGLSPTVPEVREHIKQKTGKDISEKLVRYHLNRLVEMNLVLHKKKCYQLNPAPHAEKHDIKQAFNYWVSTAIAKSASQAEAMLEKLALSYK